MADNKPPPARAPGPTPMANIAKTRTSDLVDKRVQELGDWRGKTLQRVREIILNTDPDIVEEWKWETPVWSYNGILCTGEAYKQAVKLTFAKGAALSDPGRLFNASLDGKVRRAIDIREGETVEAAALTKLIRAAIALNRKEKLGKPASKSQAPVLLSGGNPQIAKGYGDAPVQAYIAAMPVGNKRSAAASTRSLRKRCRTFGRPSNGIHRSMASKRAAISSACTA
jgi:hypothetical protein